VVGSIARNLTPERVKYRIIFRRNDRKALHNSSSDTTLLASDVETKYQLSGYAVQ